MNETQQDIVRVCDSIKQLLLDKNKKYGDSALSPVRVMSKANAVEQILIRIDDKLNRIQKGAGLLASDEDVVQDLAGYFILLIIALERQNEVNFETAKKIVHDYKGLDQAWDEKDDSPSYVGGRPSSARLLSTDECKEMGLPVTPQINWIDGPEPELDKAPGYGREFDGVQGPDGQTGEVRPEWVQKTVLGQRPGIMDIIMSGESLGRSSLSIPKTEQDKENEKTLKALEKLLTHQLGQLGIQFPPFLQDENKIEDPWKSVPV